MFVLDGEGNGDDLVHPQGVDNAALEQLITNILLLEMFDMDMGDEDEEAIELMCRCQYHSHVIFQNM